MPNFVSNDLRKSLDRHPLTDFLNTHSSKITTAVAIVAISIFAGIALMHGSPLHLPHLAHKIITIGVPIAMGTLTIGIIGASISFNRPKYRLTIKKDPITKAITTFAQLKNPTNRDAIKLVTTLKTLQPKGGNLKKLIDGIDTVRCDHYSIYPLTADIIQVISKTWETETPKENTSTSTSPSPTLTDE